MPQTRFVTQKAFEMGLKPDRRRQQDRSPGRRPARTVDGPGVRAVRVARRDRRAARLPGDLRVGPPGLRDPRARRRRRRTSAPILDLIVEKVPAAGRRSRRAAAACRSRRSTTTTTSATWRSAACAPAARRSAIACCSRTATARRKSSASRRCSASRASSASSSPRRIAGDIVAFTGMEELNVGETITSIAEPDDPAAAQDRRADDHDELPRQRRPVRRARKASTSPSRNLARAPERELKSNVALRVEDTADAGVFKVSGRGELHLSVLIETMRREGYELCVQPAAGHPPDRRRTARRPSRTRTR